VVEDVLADGTAKLRITIARTSVRDQAGSSVGSDLVRDEAAAMQGVIITEMLAPDGKLSDSHVDAANLPDNVRSRLDSLSRSLQQAAMQLPAEPVGIGATWRERKSLPAGGIRALSETTYTLTSLSHDRIAYTGAGVASGAPQTIEQDGLKVEVTNTHGHSETTGAVDLTRYAPELTSSSTFSTAMNVVSPNQAPGAGPSTVEITMAIRVTPSDPGRAAAVPSPASPPSGTSPADAGHAPVNAGHASVNAEPAPGPGPADAGPAPADAEPAPADAGPAPRDASAQGAHSAP